MPQTKSTKNGQNSTEAKADISAIETFYEFSSGWSPYLWGRENYQIGSTQFIKEEMSGIVITSPQAYLFPQETEIEVGQPMRQPQPQSAQIQAILATVTRIEEKQDIHDETTSKEHVLQQAKIDRLLEENQYFREELSEINTPKKLRKYSLSFIFLSFISLRISRLTHINLLHPMFAYCIFGAATVFLFMALLMEREDRKKGNTNV